MLARCTLAIIRSKSIYHLKIATNIIDKRTYSMAEESSLAQTRGRRIRKEKKFADESPPTKTDTKKVNDVAAKQSTPANKRKHAVESSANGRSARSKTKLEMEAQNTTKKEEVSTSDVKDDTEANGVDEDVSRFIETLKSKSSPYNNTSIEGEPSNLKITTWNVNGLRAWITKQNGLKFIWDDKADFLCLQETKCGNSKVPAEIQNQKGYRCYFNGSDDGHSGVLCLSKLTPLKVSKGIGIEIYDKEARVLTMEFDKYYIVNVYVPNSGRGLVRLDFRMKWDADFLAYLKDLDSKKPVIVCGDLNVSHHEIDLANPKTNLKTAGFTIGERNNFSKLLDETKLVDVFRLLNPDKPGCYTYWSYMKNAREKNIGWRLDYFLLSSRWVKKTCDVVIRSDIQGSDHCPVSIYLAV